MEIPPLTYEVGRSLRKLGEDYTNDFPTICDKEVVSRYSDINDELEDPTIYHLSILGNHKIIYPEPDYHFNKKCAIFQTAHVTLRKRDED